MDRSLRPSGRCCVQAAAPGVAVRSVAGAVAGAGEVLGRYAGRPSGTSCLPVLGCRAGPLRSRCARMRFPPALLFIPFCALSLSQRAFPWSANTTTSADGRAQGRRHPALNSAPSAPPHSAARTSAPPLLVEQPPLCWWRWNSQDATSGRVTTSAPLRWCWWNQQRQPAWLCSPSHCWLAAGTFWSGSKCTQNRCSQ